MPSKPRLLDLFEGSRHQRIILTISVIAVLLLELLIYLGAASQAGQKSLVVITDTQGQKVYETQGAALTSYEKMVFENTFGPLQNYRINLRTESHPFPFRAWLSAAVGIPIGLILLVAFLVRAYLVLVYGDEKDKPGDGGTTQGEKSRFGSVVHVLGGISVFHIGFLVVVAVILLWMVPNFLGDVLKVSLAMVREYRWFFLGLATFLAVLIIWVIFLRYRLSKKMLENQLDLEKYRVQTQLLMQEERRLLANPVNNEIKEH